MAILNSPTQAVQNNPSTQLGCGSIRMPFVISCAAILPSKQENISTTKYKIMDGHCYKDGDYLGKVIFANVKMIEVEINNGNRYMKGMTTLLNIKRQ